MHKYGEERDTEYGTQILEQTTVKFTHPDMSEHALRVGDEFFACDAGSSDPILQAGLNDDYPDPRLGARMKAVHFFNTLQGFEGLEVEIVDIRDSPFANELARWTYDM